MTDPLPRWGNLSDVERAVMVAEVMRCRPTVGADGKLWCSCITGSHGPHIRPYPTDRSAALEFLEWLVKFGPCVEVRFRMTANWAGVHVDEWAAEDEDGKFPPAACHAGLLAMGRVRE